MKKAIAVAICALLVLVLPTLAIAHGHHASTPQISGTISSWDDAAKEVSIKEASGKVKSFSWNDQTKVVGSPKVGEHATVSYSKDKEGKLTATHIHVGAKTASAKSTSK